jgi:adenosylcobyric acid synthase
MIQGTGSDVGKSLLVAGLCRLARRRGISVTPFKPQNMSNNAAACVGGGEIGRAQALQAAAAGVAPEPDMNPVLLKPQSDRTAQVVVQGRALRTQDAAQYMGSRDALLGAVMESFARLRARHELVVVEGAGSPAEINLRARDIANMGFARAADVPVCLVGDIHRGGVIAAIVGTRAVLDADDADMIVSFTVNKFRGDPTLFVDGVREIETRTGWPCRGVVPWLDAAAGLPAEDAVVLDPLPGNAPARSTRGLRIVAPMLSRMANFDDADPLRMEPDVDFRFIPPGQPLPRDADVVALLGTKSTLGDLAFLREQGWDHDIIAHARAGGRVVGLCGGYQMLGHSVHDPHGVDGPPGVDGLPGEVAGLGLLAVHTVMTAEKSVRQVRGRCALSGTSVSGYEIHMGRSSGIDAARPMLHLEHGADGARSPDGEVEGCYLHGLFGNDDFRRAWLMRMGTRPAHLRYQAAVERALDALADGLASALDVDAMLADAR